MREIVCNIPLAFEIEDGAIVVWANADGTTGAREIIDAIKVEPFCVAEAENTLVSRYGIDTSEAVEMVRDAMRSGNGNHSQQAVQLDTNARA